MDDVLSIHSNDSSCSSDVYEVEKILEEREKTVEENEKIVEENEKIIVGENEKNVKKEEN